MRYRVGDAYSEIRLQRLMSVDSVGLFRTAFGESSRFADAISQVVQLGASYHTVSFDDQLGDFRGVDRKDSFDAFTGNDSSHGKCGGDAVSAAMSNHDTSENLDSLFAAFLNSTVDVHCVADFERERLVAKTPLLNNIECFVSHDYNPYLAAEVLLDYRAELVLAQ